MIKIKRRCKCGCGVMTYPGNKWIKGHNISYFKHGLIDHKLYRVWAGMKTRCYNPKAEYYKDYGGRGIRVCIRWQKSFISFYNWAVKNSYKEGLTIDREDNDGNYHPNNCRFVTCRINNLNKRIYKNNTSGYIGVCFHKNINKYMAQIKVKGKNKYLGYYKTPKKAANARKIYIIKNKLKGYSI